MTLAVKPGYAPMEARVVDEIPSGPDWQYEPKWDGFRCLAFRDGDRVELRSKSGQSLTRYFPELAAALGESRDAIEDIVEPYLMQQGFVQRTPRGRMLASAAYGHLGLSAPATPQQSGLFPGDDA